IEHAHFGALACRPAFVGILLGEAGDGRGAMPGRLVHPTVEDDGLRNAGGRDAARYGGRGARYRRGARPGGGYDLQGIGLWGGGLLGLDREGRGIEEEQGERGHEQTRRRAPLLSLSLSLRNGRSKGLDTRRPRKVVSPRSASPRRGPAPDHPV